ncbi:hypothetical protein JZO70_01550 [Enterococcus sp. 669A]|uniref:Uncharacterized protein n=1 Tax=Candidatus Enterococcus moelleringii TaxID=2815325 RepID=A0ABS3L5C4_9ENTE|nr:hypothetical protein [Enterococcus sp. 669A]MBO1304829.1 hypothetical protein [Enterococcus sp. 669A]
MSKCGYGLPEQLCRAVSGQREKREEHQGGNRHISSCDDDVLGCFSRYWAC